MAVANKDSRFPVLYDDPYEEPPVSLASTPSADLPARDSASHTSGNTQDHASDGNAQQDQAFCTATAVNGSLEISEISHSRPPGDGASARRYMPPLSIAFTSNDDIDDDENDDAFHSPCGTEEADPPQLSSAILDSPPPPIVPRGGSGCGGGVMENPSAGNYDEPWDLTSKFRQLEEKFRAVPKLSQVVGATPVKAPVIVPRLHSQSSSEDTRVLADGYDRPWDLQPHRRDDRDDAGYIVYTPIY